MSNVLVTGLPWGKDARAVVKQTLRDEFSAMGTVTSVTWGSRKGACYVIFENALSASKAIARFHEARVLFVGHGSKTVRCRLDFDQGRIPPSLADEPEGPALRDFGDGAGAMPVAFTSRQGKINEDREIERERRWRMDTLTWCSICNSREHKAKVLKSPKGACPRSSRAPTPPPSAAAATGVQLGPGRVPPPRGDRLHPGWRAHRRPAPRLRAAS